MRSPNELFFRLKQETTNLYLLAARPQFTSPNRGLLPLPDARSTGEALRGSEFSDKTLAIAEQILTGELPLLGVTIKPGDPIKWRFDYQHERSSDLSYFRRIPYSDFSAVGDHKFIWELNRHQHLVLLAQAYRLRNDGRYLGAILRQLESWTAQNPFQRGINWASALEVAFRALSWLWIYHLVGEELPENARQSLRSGLYQHALHLAANLSIYFSPNTHLLGEAVALFSIVTCFPAMPGASRWLRESRAIVEEQLGFQVRADGSHFEQSTYYHVYALDFFLWFYLLAGRPASFRPTLHKMADYLFWLLGRTGHISFLGDDDGGRLFYPYGERSGFGGATLATAGILLGKSEWLGNESDVAEQAAWWVGPATLPFSSSKRHGPSGCCFFPDSGALFLQNARSYLQFDGGPFGYGGAGHSHSDSLSLCLNQDGADVLIDPGTYTYISSPSERNWFRGSKAHNTISINGTDQGSATTPFRWDQKPKVHVSGWAEVGAGGWVDATCSYRGYTHRRRLLLEESRLSVLDLLEGPPGESTCEQSWHWGDSGAERVVLSSSEAAAWEPTKTSVAYGAVKPAKETIVRWTGSLPRKIGTVIAPTATAVDVDELERQFDRMRPAQTD